MKLWVAPSKIAFLYDLCARCTWLNYHNVKPMGGDFAEFDLLDLAQKRGLPVGTRLDLVGIAGAVATLGGKACSVDYGVPGVEARVFGSFDMLAALDEGGFAIVDLKSGRPSEETRDRYRKQLTAYALALGEPDRGEAIDVRTAYLLHCWPTVSTLVPEVEPPLLMMQWPLAAVEVAIDLDEVRAAIRGLVELVAREEVPAPGSGCPTCAYIESYCRTVRDWKGRERRLAEVGA